MLVLTGEILDSNKMLGVLTTPLRILSSFQYFHLSFFTDFNQLLLDKRHLTHFLDIFFRFSQISFVCQLIMQNNFSATEFQSWKVAKMLHDLLCGTREITFMLRLLYPGKYQVYPLEAYILNLSFSPCVVIQSQTK